MTDAQPSGDQLRVNLAQDALKGADTDVVMKVGGNVINPRPANIIDDDFISDFGSYLHEALTAFHRKLVIVPGGVGSALFIKWGRLLRCSEAQLNQIGCDLINLSASILASGLSATVKEHEICPIAATTLDSLALCRKHFQVTVCGACVTSAISSDSLAALIAEHTKSRLLLVKNGRPFNSEESFYSDPSLRTISLAKMMNFYHLIGTPEAAGHFASIDYLCMKIIQRSKIPTGVILKQSLMKRDAGQAVDVIEILHDS
jgi:uridylate kinase